MGGYDASGWTEIELGAPGSSVKVRGWTGIRLSREINGAGLFTAQIPHKEAVRQGWTRNLDTTSERVYWERSNLGGWVGIVTNTVIRDGILEITAQNNLIRLKRKLAAFGDMQQVAPGVVLKMAVDQYNAVAPTAAFAWSVRDETSERIDIAATPAVDIYDELLPQLTAGMNMELGVTSNLLTYTRRLGTTRSVVIQAGEGGASTQAVAGSISSDLFSVTNHLRGIGLERVVTTGSNGKAVTWVQSNYGVKSINSETRWTPLMERRDYPSVRSQAVMTARLNSELTYSQYMYPTLELTVAELNDGLFGLLSLGDIITVAYANVGTYQARIMATTFDNDSATMTLSMRSVTGL